MRLASIFSLKTKPNNKMLNSTMEKLFLLSILIYTTLNLMNKRSKCSSFGTLSFAQYLNNCSLFDKYFSLQKTICYECDSKSHDDRFQVKGEIF